MGTKEQQTAIDLINELMKHDFKLRDMPEELNQVDQAYGVTMQAIEGLAKASGDKKLNSLAKLLFLAWRHD